MESMVGTLSTTGGVESNIPLTVAVEESPFTEPSLVAAGSEKSMRSARISLFFTCGEAG
jgi:hypothetical protein